MEWMWISRCGLHPKQLFSPLMSSSKSLLLRRMNELELLPLEAVGFPVYLRAKAKATPFGGGSLKPSGAGALQGCRAGW